MAQRKITGGRKPAEKSPEGAFLREEGRDVAWEKARGTNKERAL